MDTKFLSYLLARLARVMASAMQYLNLNWRNIATRLIRVRYSDAVTDFAGYFPYGGYCLFGDVAECSTPHTQSRFSGSEVDRGLAALIALSFAGIGVERPVEDKIPIWQSILGQRILCVRLHSVLAGSLSDQSRPKNDLTSHGWRNIASLTISAVSTGSESIESVPFTRTSAPQPLARGLQKQHYEEIA